jgi:cell division inhibitor SepF
MGFMQRVKVMLGLADEYDDEYEDEYEDDDRAVDDDEDAGYEPVSTSREYGRESARESAREPVREPAYASPYGAQSASVKRIHREPDIPRAREAAPLRAVQPPAPPAQVKIHTVEPRTYSEAQNIADKFKAGQPVILNLTVTDPDLAKRMIDFASGLTYGLDGSVQKVSDRVFMLTPRNVDVSTAGQIRSSRSSSLFGPE